MKWRQKSAKVWYLRRGGRIVAFVELLSTGWRAESENSRHGAGDCDTLYGAKMAAERCPVYAPLRFRRDLLGTYLR